MDSSIASLDSLSSDMKEVKTFRFFDLPSELRLRVYELVLLVGHGGATLDLNPYNFRMIAPRLSCFLVCRQMHHEAYPVFYGSPSQPVALFPHPEGKFFNTKKPLLTRLSPTYRSAINAIEMRLGPGWSKIPRCWHTGPELGLADCVSLRTLKVVVQIDPSASYFDGFRGKGHDKYTYRDFCITLLHQIMQQIPSLETIEIDAWRSIETIDSSPLVQALIAETKGANKRLIWGPEKRQTWGSPSECGWDQLERAMASLVISPHL